MTEMQAAAVADLKRALLARRLQMLEERLTLATYDELSPEILKLKEQIKNL